MPPAIHSPTPSRPRFQPTALLSVFGNSTEENDSQAYSQVGESFDVLFQSPCPLNGLPTLSDRGLDFPGSNPFVFIEPLKLSQLVYALVFLLHEVPAR